MVSSAGSEVARRGVWLTMFDSDVKPLMTLAAVAVSFQRSRDDLQDSVCSDNSVK
jgi:hypothetical protein